MMPNGVTVAQLILVQFVEVRILIGQPFPLLFRIVLYFRSVCFLSQQVRAMCRFPPILSVPELLLLFIRFARYCPAGTAEEKNSVFL